MDLQDVVSQNHKEYAVNIRPFDQTSLNNKLFITGTKIPPINVKRKKITTLTGVFFH